MVRRRGALLAGFAAIAIVAVACRSPRPATSDVRVAKVQGVAPASLPDDRATDAPTCPAKVDRSKSEPFVIEGNGAPKTARILVRPAEEPSSQVVLVVPVDGGVVEHVLGTYGDPECDDTFRPALSAERGIVHVTWKVEHLRLSAIRTGDRSPCDEIGVGDCTLGCKDEGATTHHLFVDERTGRRLLSVETARAPDEATAPPDVTFDAELARVTVHGAGCLESIGLR